MQIQFQQRANSLYSGDLIKLPCLFVYFKRHANTVQMQGKLTPGAHLTKMPPLFRQPDEMKRKIHRSNLISRLCLQLKQLHQHLRVENPWRRNCRKKFIFSCTVSTDASRAALNTSSKRITFHLTLEIRSWEWRLG